FRSWKRRSFIEASLFFCPKIFNTKKKRFIQTFNLNICLILRSIFDTMIMMNEKQLEILNAAEKLFEEKGFDGTSVRDIAKAADVNLAMISYYFGSKEKLLDTLFEVRLYNFKINQEVIFDEKLSPFESLE